MPPKRYPLRVLRRPAAAARRAVRGAAQEAGPGERNEAVLEARHRALRSICLRDGIAVAQAVGDVGQPAAPAAGEPDDPTRDLFDAWLSVVSGIRLLRLRIELGDPADLRAELARFETAKALCESFGCLGHTRIPRAAVQCLSERSQMSALRALLS